MSISHRLTLLALLAACGPGTPMATDGDPTTGDGTTTTTTAPVTTGDPPAPTTGGSTSATSSTSSTSSTTAEATFIIPPEGCDQVDEYDVRCSIKECNPWLQNCPDGQKCSPYANDGGSSWNALRCVPLAREPAHAGEPCTVEGSGVSGIDSCDIDSMCYGVDPDTLTGTCVPTCDGTPDVPECPEGTGCLISNEGALTLCLPRCDPLAGNCPEGQVCAHASGGFFCALDASGDEGQVFDPCEFVNDCDPGLFCGAVELAGECDPGGYTCCLAYCDVSMPAPCPGAGQVCESFWEEAEAPAGNENLGVCRLPG